MPQLLEDGKNTIVVSHSDFGGVTQEFAPDEGDNTTRFYVLRNATEQLGNLVQAHGSVSAAQATGGDDIIRSVYFPIERQTNVQTVLPNPPDLPGTFFPFCAYQFGAWVILGGNATPYGYSFAWVPSSPPDLTAPWTQQTPLGGALTLASIRCFGMFGGNLYASGIAGTFNNVYLLQLDLTTFPSAPCWTIMTPNLITGSANARATTLVTFGDLFYAGTSEGVYVTDDPVAGTWSLESGPSSTETFYLVLRPDLSVLYAIGQTAIWFNVGAGWQRVTNASLVPVALSGNTSANEMSSDYGMHAACWYVDSLVWLSNEFSPRIVRYAPPNIPDLANLDAAPVRINVEARSVCAYRNDLYGFSRDGSALLFRRAYKAQFDVSDDFATRSITTGGGNPYASISGADCLYTWLATFAADSVRTAFVRPYTPLAIARVRDGTNRIVTSCLDVDSGLMRVICLNASSTGYSEIATWPATPVPNPQATTVQFLGTQFYASRMFPLEQDDAGVFSQTAVAAAAVTFINGKIPNAALTYVPRGRYAVVHNDRLWLLNLAEDPNETVMNASQKPVGVRCCVPREVAFFNIPVFYGPAQLWLTNNVTSLTNSAQQAANDTEITGGFSFRGRLYVTTNDAVWIVQETQSGEPDGISLVTNNYGCTSHNSIVQGVNMVWWWSEVGPVVFDGQSIRVCRGSIRARQIINAVQLGTGERGLTGFNAVHGQYYAQARQVLWWVNASGLSWQNTCVAIDVDTEELSLFYPQSDGDASERGLSAVCSGVLENDDDTSTVYIAHVNGALYQVNRAGDNDTHPIDFLARTQAIGAKQPGQRFRCSEFSMRARVNDTPINYRAVLWPVASGKLSEQPVFMPSTLDQMRTNNGNVQDGDYLAQVQTVPNQGAFGTDAAWEMRVRSTQPVEVASLTEKWAVVEDKGNLMGRGGNG